MLLFTNEPFAQRATTALAEDAEGALWIGTSESRLMRWQARKLVEFPHRVTRGAVTAFAVEPDGHLWVGSVTGGLKRIQSGSESILNVTNSLMSDSIRTLHRDADGDLWIGTGGDGLGYWRKGKLTSFTAAQGLSARTVLQIVEDDLGNLWLGASRGIFRARKSDLKDCAAGNITFVHTRSYGLNDGMPAQECSGGLLWERNDLRAAVVLAGAGMFAATLIWLRRRYRRRLARLHTLNTIERERLRISQDMHDYSGNMLTQVSQLSDMGLHDTENERIGDRAPTVKPLWESKTTVAALTRTEPAQPAMARRTCVPGSLRKVGTLNSPAHPGWNQSAVRLPLAEMRTANFFHDSGPPPECGIWHATEIWY